jgi:hypothetical protein
LELEVYRIAAGFIFNARVDEVGVLLKLQCPDC